MLAHNSATRPAQCLALSPVLLCILLPGDSGVALGFAEGSVFVACINAAAASARILVA
jgi:hypothetical protein